MRKAYQGRLLPIASLTLASIVAVRLAASATVIQLNLLVLLDSQTDAEASVQTASIEAMLERAVNRDWRLLGGVGGSSGGIQARLAARVHRVATSVNGSGDSGWVAALQTACQWTGGYHGILAVGDCKLASIAGELATSMALPLVTIPTALCDYWWMNNFTVVAMEPPSWYLEAAVLSMETHRTVDSVLILHDSRQAPSSIEQLQAILTKRFPQLASKLYQLDSMEPGISAQTLLSMLNRIETKGLNFVVVIASNAAVIDVIRLASSNGFLSVNLYWIVISAKVSPSQLLNLMPTSPSKLQVGAPNLLLIRSPTNGQLEGGVCSVDLAAIIDSCKADDIQSIQVRTLDALLAFGRGFNNVLGNSSVLVNGSSVLSNGIQTTSNASCSGGGWNGGPEVAKVLRNSNSYASALSTIKFSSTSGYLQSDYLEFYALQRCMGCGASTTGSGSFLESGRYYPQNRSTRPLFKSRERWLIFPNTFVGFGNLSLSVCAVVTSPYSVNVSALGQRDKSFQVALLDILAKNLQFSYVLTEPALSVGDQHSFCMNEVLNGRADFALLFDAPKSNISTSLFDYSLEFPPTWLGILARRPARNSRMWAFYLPFDTLVWVTVLAFVLAASLLVYLLAYFNNFSGPNLQLPYAISDEVWFQEYLFSVLSSFLQQGHDFYPLALSPRIVLAFWWMLTVIIYGAYTGELASQLTILNSPEPISSLDSLIESSNYDIVEPNGLASSPGLPTSIQSRLTSTSVSGIQCAETVLHSPDGTAIACIAEKNIVNYYATVHCQQAYAAKELLTGYDTFNGLAFAKNWPYAERFNFLIQRVKEIGLFDQLNKLYFPSENADCKVAKIFIRADSVSMEDIGGVLICGGVLYILGLLIVGFEEFWAKVLKKEPF